MSAYVGGTVMIGTYTPIPVEWASIYNLDVEQIREHNRVVSEHEKKERQRLEEAKSFPVDGMSGELDRNKTGFRIWPSGKDDDLYVSLVEGTCDFCGFTGWHMVEIGTDDWGSLNVCRSCMDKMFDAALEKVAGK